MGSGELRIIPIQGIPEARPGDSVAELVLAGMAASSLAGEPGDVLVVTQKVVSKAEGRLVRLADVEPSPLAIEYAARWERDPRQVELVLRESVRIVRMDRGLIIAETRHGFVCANAGVDLSNVTPGYAALLPLDPDRSAATIRRELCELTGWEPAVIISDTFGRAWRNGIVNVAIGVAGLRPLRDYRGLRDPHGNELRVTVIAVADELAAAAELVMGKTEGCPAAIIRGFAYEPGDGTARELVMPPERDLFR
ncbi:coenzyme F420-0:L-glutamate ligase [Thermomicrobium sp. CFH 73360]|uniref:coenzyme F420-0:L-glutamate ligase n=1 Tax=Thermomicrobium sp. CFH 73360 TaxID=2951987 RepID=UPI0020775EDE|nr:coenzyme F420-0:L-glutamate ligase [Thermomicrobium sp. CFH 73360]MCM8746798.1 coenzyme F420-0:L-glutamate ligase [Thermomicrobium sp. CFH 73360]